jgi:hypothetical protein
MSCATCGSGTPAIALKFAGICPVAATTYLADDPPGGIVSSTVPIRYPFCQTRSICCMAATLLSDLAADETVTVRLIKDGADSGAPAIVFTGPLTGPTIMTARFPTPITFNRKATIDLSVDVSDPQNAARVSAMVEGGG